MVMICPQCRSARVCYVDVWLGRGSGNMYKCLDCGFQGASFIDVDEETARKFAEEKQKSD